MYARRRAPIRRPACLPSRRGRPNPSRGAQGGLHARAGLHPLPAARGDPHAGRLRRRERGRGPHVHRGGARARRRTSGVSRSWAPPGRCSTSCSRAWACSRDDVFVVQRPEVPPARQPRPGAGGDRELPGVPARAGRADPPEGHLHAGELLDEAPARRPDRDHAPARPSGDPRHRAACGAAVPDPPSGGGALHALAAGHAARGLRAAARGSWRCRSRTSPARARARAGAGAEPATVGAPAPEDARGRAAGVCSSP